MINNLTEQLKLLLQYRVSVSIKIWCLEDKDVNTCVLNLKRR